MWAPTVQEVINAWLDQFIRRGPRAVDPDHYIFVLSVFVLTSSLVLLWQALQVFIDLVIIFFCPNLGVDMQFVLFYIIIAYCNMLGMVSSIGAGSKSFDARPVLSRSRARDVYDCFAETGHAWGKDADSGYGGPAVNALLEMAEFDKANSVLDYGCGQGKLAELVLTRHGSSDNDGKNKNKSMTWKGVDQSPKMVHAFTKRCVERFGSERCNVVLLPDGDPCCLDVEKDSVDRFVSTYCLDLMSESDMYAVLEKAEECLDAKNGTLLLAGITWGYKNGNWKTFLMTLIWETLYRLSIETVGGCRPQLLRPYLEEKGWRVEKIVRTMPAGYPWMVSEVISARPPIKKNALNYWTWCKFIDVSRRFTWLLCSVCIKSF